jgi:hypothetical protein
VSELTANTASGVNDLELSGVVRRAIASLDLVNLGFYSEAFVTAFSLLDDLTQDVMRAGLKKQGLTEDEQHKLLRAIKEQRLDHFLNLVAKICGWRALKEADPDLWKTLEKVNAKRNDVMHNARRLNREEAINGIDTTLRVVQWLRTNPFGYAIAEIPVLVPTNVQFHIYGEGIEAPDGDQGSGA